MRKLFSALILLLAIFFAISQLGEFEQITLTLRQGDVFWIVVAICVQAAFMLNLAATYRAVYRVLGIEASLPPLLPVVAAANFVNVVAPSAGMGGIAVFLADAKQRGLPTGKVTLAGVLSVLYDYVAFVCVLTLGLIVLIRRDELDLSELVASAILIGAAAALLMLLGLGSRSAAALERVLIAAARRINRLLRPLLRRDYLSEAGARQFAAEAAEGLAIVRSNPDALWLPGALALSSKALLISILFLMFLAFHQPFSVGTLVAGFSIAYLFFIVSVTPSGLGVVEGVMTLTLNQLRVPLASAAVITLAYRGLTFWLPFGYGFLAFRYLAWRTRRRERTATPVETSMALSGIDQPRE